MFAEFSKKEVSHWFVRKENVLEAFVIEKNNKITDFISFYCLPSTILANTQHKELKAAYGYYIVSNEIPLTDLALIALIKAKEMKYDVFNCLNVMDNKQFLDSLLFLKGDGYLNYYLYNWKLKETLLDADQVGIILL